MKKLILSVVGILAILLAFSFTNSNFNKERTIKITSKNTIEFDMVQNGKTTKGIKTPYEFKFNEEKGNFIFRTKSGGESRMKLSVKDKHGSLTANWNIIVLTIRSDEMSTFGLE